MKIKTDYVLKKLDDLLNLEDGDIEGFVIKLISDIEENSTDNWIDVDDRLPEKSGFYIVFTGEVNSDFFHLHKKDFHHYQDFVTHWQPMPEPPSKTE